MSRLMYDALFPYLTTERPLMSYEAYYVDAETALQKLSRYEISSQAPAFAKQFHFVSSLAEDLAFLDRCAAVPGHVTNQVFHHATYKQARRNADDYLTVLKACDSIEKLQREFNNLEQRARNIRQQCDDLRQATYVVDLYTLRSSLANAAQTDELVAKTILRLEQLQQASESMRADVRTVAEETKTNFATHAESFRQEQAKTAAAFQQVVTEFKATLTAAVHEGSELNERLKKDHETNEEQNRVKAMTAFGASFRDEARICADASRVASWLVLLTMMLLVLALSIFHQFLPLVDIPSVADIANGAKVPPPADFKDLTVLTKVSFRILTVAFAVWLAAHFFSDRRNYAHLSAIYRHKASLCDAYIAVAPKMSVEERNQYLLTILPHLASLGSTGFIGKEYAPETPAESVVKMAMDKIPSGKK
jgi:hypothetical protein